MRSMVEVAHRCAAPLLLQGSSCSSASICVRSDCIVDLTVARSTSAPVGLGRPFNKN